MQTTRLMALAAFLCTYFSAPSQVLLWKKSPNGVTLLEDNEPLYHYQSSTKEQDGKYARSNYIHPFYGLHGEVLTEDFPDDHPHHRGIFWAWHQLYVEDRKAGDGWACEGLSWEVDKIKTKINYGYAELNARVFWRGKVQGSAEEDQLIREETTITYQPIENGKWYDFDIALTALKHGTAIGGSEDDKGYSGFSARLFLPDDLIFRNKDGVVEPQRTPVEAGPWIDMLGTFDSIQQLKSGVTIMNHPSNPDAFKGWILRAQKSMQNAAFPGATTFPLPKGKTLHLRYRILVHPADWTAQDIETLYSAYQRL